MDLVGFTSRTSAQTRQESAEWLDEFYRLLKPLALGLHGRVVKTIGDALLVVFESPTDALLFGMAAQDAVFEHNRFCPETRRMEIRVAANVGEVRLHQGDVFGEAVNITARIEEITPAGEVWFSEAVYLAMNKSEVPAEKLGQRQLKGLSEPITLYRVPQGTSYRLQVAAKAEESLRDYPYGGAALHRAEGRRLPPGVQSILWWLEQSSAQLVGTISALLRGRARLRLLIVAAVGLLALGVIFWIWPRDSFHQIRLELENGNAKKALALLQMHPQGELPEGLALAARARLRLPQPEPEQSWTLLQEALAKEPGLLSDRRVRQDLVLCLDSESARPVMEWLLQGRAGRVMDELYAAARDRRYFLRWNSIRLLEKLGKTDIDYVQAYIYDLDYAGSCSTRKRAAQKLGELKDRRALDALRRAKERSFLENLCMGNTLEQALQALEEK